MEIGFWGGEVYGLYLFCWSQDWLGGAVHGWQHLWGLIHTAVWPTEHAVSNTVSCYLLTISSKSAEEFNIRQQIPSSSFIFLFIFLFSLWILPHILCITELKLLSSSSCRHNTSPVAAQLSRKWCAEPHLQPLETFVWGSLNQQKVSLDEISLSVHRYICKRSFSVILFN